jgi:hypothetical protein
MRDFLQFKINDKNANVISAVSVIYFATVRNLVEINLLFLNNNKFIISGVFSILILLTQINYFVINYKDYVLVSLRLVFCYLFSLLFIMIIYNSLELYSIYNSSNYQKIKIQAPIVQIKGMVSRRYGSFEYKNKTISHKIEGKLEGEIEKNGLSNYCAYITYHKGLFDFYIIDEFKINYCKHKP